MLLYRGLEKANIYTLVLYLHVTAECFKVIGHICGTITTPVRATLITANASPEQLALRLLSSSGEPSRGRFGVARPQLS